MPSNSQLFAARQQQTRSTNSPTGNSEVANNDDGQDRPSLNLPAGIVTECSEPWQLQHYDPLTHDVIERAKQFSHCDAASIDPFPPRPPFNSKAIEYIDEAIAEHHARGLIVSEGSCHTSILVSPLIRVFRLVATQRIGHHQTRMYPPLLSPALYPSTCSIVVGGPWQLAFRIEEKGPYLCHPTIHVES